MQKLMGDEGWGGGGPCFSLLTPSVCGNKGRYFQRDIGLHHASWVILHAFCRLRILKIFITGGMWVGS